MPDHGTPPEILRMRHALQMEEERRRERREALDFADYCELRRRGDTTPAYRKSLRNFLLARRKERIEEYEKTFPHFKKNYENGI